RLAPLNDRKEELEKEIKLAEARGENVTDALKSEYSSVSLLSFRFPFFLRALAVGVISAGQRNIKLIADLVRSKRFSVKYGDTDCLYLACSEECFQKCDEAYDNCNGISNEEYWSRMVNISIEVIERLRDEVNNFLRNNNGSSYLKMAYEEVLFPLERKNTTSKYFREVSKKVMDESMRLDNTRILHRIVEDVFKETINGISQIDLNEVVKTAGLTPEPYLYEIPEPGE
ncbi:6034_t:CDS:2, partial [Funneliformis geosporum]